MLQQIPIGYAGGEETGVEEHRLVQLAKKAQWTTIEAHYAQLKKSGQAKHAEDLNPVDHETSLNVLMMACRHNRRGVIDALLEFGDTLIDLSARTKDGFTALHFAVASCSDVIVENMLKAGADPHIAGGPEQQLPIHIACQRHAGAMVICKLLLKRMHADGRLILDGVKI